MCSDYPTYIVFICYQSYAGWVIEYIDSWGVGFQFNSYRTIIEQVHSLIPIHEFK